MYKCKSLHFRIKFKFANQTRRGFIFFKFFSKIRHGRSILKICSQFSFWFPWSFLFWSSILRTRVFLFLILFKLFTFFGSSSDFWWVENPFFFRFFHFIFVLVNANSGGVIHENSAKICVIEGFIIECLLIQKLIINNLLLIFLLFTPISIIKEWIRIIFGNIIWKV